MALPLVTGAFVLWRFKPETAWPAILVLWALTGVCYAMQITPSGRLLRRSSHEGDRPALFAAQFALSHVCWLITYPLAGSLGAIVGLPTVMIIHAAITLAAVALAARLWPADDPETIAHDHPALQPDHPHLAAHKVRGRENQHSHVYVIDDLHPRWPVQ